MQEIHRRKSGFASANGQKLTGVFMLGIGVLGVMTTGALGLFIGLGVLFIIIGFWSDNRPVIKLHDDHFEMKVAPVAARHLVRYREIDEIIEKSKDKVFVVVKGKKIRLPTAILEPADAELLLSTLRKAATSGGASKSESGR